eukprot:jgi/Bigna1/89102/estExt_fgenesh1_pg.C_430112
MSGFDDAQLAAAIAASLNTNNPRDSLIEFPPLLGVRTADEKTNLVIKPSDTDKVFARHEPEISRNGPYEILIKMTIGSFKNYNSSCLLHCGISDSKGVVYNFDQNGYHKDDYWKESIRVKINDPNNSNGGGLSATKWDDELRSFDMMHKMSGRQYVALGANCYDYAVGFLNFIKFKGSSSHTTSSIEKHLLNVPAQRAIKYLEYWRRISRNKAIPYPFKVPTMQINFDDEGKKNKEGAQDQGGRRTKGNNNNNNNSVDDNDIKPKPTAIPSLEKQFSGESKKNPTKGLVRIVLYSDGFTVNGGQFRAVEGDKDNKSFVTALLNGKVPQELVTMANGNKLDVDLEDLRPRLGSVKPHYLPGTTLERVHKGTIEYLEFGSGGSVTYSAKGIGPETFNAGSYSIEERPYTRMDGKVVQRKYFIMKGTGEFQGKEQVWEWDRLKCFGRKREEQRRE